MKRTLLAMSIVSALVAVSVVVLGADSKDESKQSTLSSPANSSDAQAPVAVGVRRQQKSYPSSSNVMNDDEDDGKSAKRSFYPGTPPPGSNLFNTSIAFTVPLFVVNTKSLTSARSFFDGFETNGAGVYNGGIGFPLGSGVVAGIAVPALIAGILILLFDVFSRPFLTPAAGGRASESIFSGGLGSIPELLLTFVENTLDQIPSIDGEECIKRSVCEAHAKPKKYGIIALPLQLLFPPYPYTGTDDTSKLSKFQLAARYGKNANSDCSAQYHQCVINPLDLISSLARMFTDL